MKIADVLRLRAVAVLFLLNLQGEGQGSATSDLDIDGAVQGLKAALSGFKDVLRERSAVLTELATQTMRMGLQHEDRIRAEGASGVVQVRSFQEGSSNYYANSIATRSVASFHDHGSSRWVLGMGEAVYVMNGVEFRTRHSDYVLHRPSRASTNFLATENIDLPGVPTSVTLKTTVQKQEQEMREYFRAFQAQDTSIRDYRPYFKPIICYLEGAWMEAPRDSGPDNWFATSKSFLAGFSWEELHDRYRAEVAAGLKTSRERTAHLPTTIAGIDDVTGNPVYAQWNYRPLCFPVAEDIPTRHFKEVDHMSYRRPRGLHQNETFYRRGAHFRLDEQAADGTRTKTLLHRIISGIPGMDNVPSVLTFPSMDDAPARNTESGDVINLGFYNHWYDIGFHNGHRDIPRGFSDPNLFVALNNQSKIASLNFRHCTKRTSCRQKSAKLSYLLPLEVVYLTPLLSWNPHSVTDFQGDDVSAWRGNKNGNALSRAYNGVSDNFLFQTPATFFRENAADIDPADSRKLTVWVKDSTGVPHQVAASGLRTILPTIEGVGQVRLRFPIVPVHGMGSPVWKELKAFKDTWEKDRQTALARTRKR